MYDNLKPVIPSVVTDLKRAGETFNNFNLDSPENRRASEWLENNFVIASCGRIDWDALPDSLCLTWTNTSELLSAFEKIVRENKLKNSVNVLWTNVLKTPLKIEMNVMLKYAEVIFEEDWDTWVYSEEDNWCIEVYHEGDICFGYTCRGRDPD